MALNVDLSKLRDLAKGEVDEANNRGNSEDSQYKIFYPGENGSFRVKLLYNVASGTVQRRITRHDTGKGKVPCLAQYGEECPICSKIKEVENALGKEIGAFRKYGYKTRGICYAQIMYLDDAYQKRDGHPEVGDIVLFMYPISLYNEINKIIVEAGEHLGDLVTKNVGKTITISRSQNGGGAPKYTASVYPYGDETSYKDGSDPENPQLTGEEIYENMVNAIPDLNDTIIPKYPSEKVRTDVDALAETIGAEYLNGNIMNPGDEPKEKEKPTAAPVSAPAQNPTPTPASVTAPEPVAEPKTDGGKPECFGHHVDGDRKCLICPMEPECYTAG